MNLTEFANRYWIIVLHLTILSGMITGFVAFTNIIVMPQIPNYPVYFFGIQTSILFGFFLVLFFQPKEKSYSSDSVSIK